MRVVIVLALLAVAAVATRQFDGHSVIRLKISAPPSQNEINTVHALHDRVDVDWWSDTDFRVTPDNKDEILTYLADNNVAWDTMIEDVQPLIDRENQWHAELAALEANKTMADLLRTTPEAPIPDFFKDYRKLDDINAFVDSLVAQFPQLATKVTIGTSYQGRTIYGVVVASSKTPANRGIYYEGGIHSREWVAHTTVSFILWNLLSGYGNDPVVTKMVDSIKWHIVPALNVDGYVYTWSGDRMWRKTRSPNPGSSCIGTDPNRNWDNHWCQQGASKDPCSDSYCGRAAFTEKEVKAAADYIAKDKGIRGAIDFHSYSQLWMQPYGWTAQKPKDYDKQRELGLAAVAAIKKNGGKTYQEGSIYTIIYPASGSSADWAYDTANVTYPYGVELRDTGQYGFLLPASQIIPTGQEIWAAAQVMAQYILDH
jgi:murein tripeptide amidase MpaA